MFECRTRNREETWLPVDTNSESRKVSSPDLPIRMIQSLIQNERASWITFFFFSFSLWALSSMIQCLVDRSGCEPCNNKSSFPGEVTKTIALPGVLGMQGHPHNTNLPAVHKSCRKHLSGRKQFIQ